MRTEEAPIVNRSGMETIPGLEVPPVDYPEVIFPNNSVAEQRIVDVLNQGVNGELEVGYSWYFDTSKYLESIGKENGLNLRQSAAIFAVLSLRRPLASNKQVADRVIKTKNTNGLMGYSAARIQSIFDGEDLDDVLLHGRTDARKVASFYLNLAEPETSAAVTIDRHMWDVLLGVKTPLRIRRAKYTAEEYEWAEDRFRVIAEAEGKLPHQIQAATWLIWRRVNGVGGGGYHPQGTQETFDLSDLATRSGLGS